MSYNSKRFHENIKDSLTSNTTLNMDFILFKESSYNQSNQRISNMKMLTHKVFSIYRIKEIKSEERT